MAIRLTQAEVIEQFQEADEEELQFDPADALDITRKYDARFSQGWRRRISLREDIHLHIDQTQSAGRILVDCPEGEWDFVDFIFLLSGKTQWITASKTREAMLTYVSGQYYLESNGLQPQLTCDYHYDFDVQFWSSVSIFIRPRILHSFIASPDREPPKYLQHLIKSPGQLVYVRSGDIQPMMATVLQQILHCPYQGMIKRVYLESKAMELIALVLDHEVAIQQGEIEKSALKAEQLERVHYAKEILLRDLNDPPSLEELARQASLNDFLLKKGFRQAFGTTVFGMLKSHRLEIAQQLLREQDISIAEVAHRIGYGSSNAFWRAFKQKFGISPKEYQQACR